MITTCCGFNCDATTDAEHPQNEGWLGMPDDKVLCVDCRAECEEASDDDENVFASVGCPEEDGDYGFWGTDDY